MQSKKYDSSSDPIQKDPSEYLNPSTPEGPGRTLDIIFIKLLVHDNACNSKLEVKNDSSLDPTQKDPSEYLNPSTSERLGRMLEIIITKKPLGRYVYQCCMVAHWFCLFMCLALPSPPCHLILIISQLSCHLVFVLVHILVGIPTLSPSSHPCCPVHVIILSASLHLHLLVYNISSSYIIWLISLVVILSWSSWPCCLLHVISSSLCLNFLVIMLLSLSASLSAS